MTQGSITSPEVQQQVLTYLECKKSVEWISTKTGLAKTTIKRIRKRVTIKYRNEYFSPTGRLKKVSPHQKKKIKGFIQKNERKTLNSTKTELNLSVSKQTLGKT
jgi:hypothetical protein